MTAPAHGSRRTAPLRIWILALALFGLGLTAWELFWRERGFEPTLNNDPGLWAAARRRAAEAGRDAVVLIGSSRMQLALSPDDFVAATGLPRPIQLAIPMSPPVPVLDHLAREASFSGLVICEVAPLLFFKRRPGGLRIAAAHLEAFRRQGWSDGLEHDLRVWVQSRLVSGLPDLHPRQLLRAVLRQQWPAPGYVVTTSERFAFADFRRFAPHAAIHQALARRPPPEPETSYDAARVLERTRRVGALVERIRARGGEVVFVRLPSSLFVRRDERILVPRSRYWDVFAAQSDAIAIHFEDHPQLSRYRPPDGHHLDGRSTPGFSRALGRILVRELRARGQWSRAPGG